MSHETKWDIFNKLLAAYLEDKKRLDKLVNEPDEHIPELDAMYFNKSYNAALPDNLPVIPKAVGDAITYAKANGISIGDVLWRCGEGRMFDCDEVESWINDHGDTFARAWVLNMWYIEETGEIGGCN